MGDGFLCKVYSGNGSFAFPVGDAYGTTEYSPSTLNFTADLDSSTVCVRVTNARHPDWPGTDYPTYITRYWTATSSDNTFTCTASFIYMDGDVVLGGTPVQTEAALYHKVWNGANWMTKNQTDADTNTLSSVVNSFSDHTAFSGSPLAVTLAAFDAQATADGVMLAWETVSELDNAGFNVYRAESETGPWSKLNDALIPAAAPGSSEGHAVYSGRYDHTAGRNLLVRAGRRGAGWQGHPACAGGSSQDRAECRGVGQIWRSLRSLVGWIGYAGGGSAGRGQVASAPVVRRPVARPSG